MFVQSVPEPKLSVDQEVLIQQTKFNPTRSGD